jgi:hypothetical protein
MRFVLGRNYTRDEIHSALGGSKQSYLPTVGGRVVCGAFTRHLNPEVPNVVLAGFGPTIERSAEIFAGQSTSVPVFVKNRVNVWEYVGDYRVRQLSRDSRVVADRARAAGRSGEVSLVLFLDRTDESGVSRARSAEV